MGRTYRGLDKKAKKKIKEFRRTRNGKRIVKDERKEDRGKKTGLENIFSY